MVAALSIKGLTKIYSNGMHALKGINLTVEQGDFFALLGPNGAGKSTTIGIITSLINKTCGQISVFGHDLSKNPAQAKATIGVVPQEFNFSIFETLWDILLNQAGYYGIARKQAALHCEELLHKLGLSEKRHQQARFLSGGMKRRLMIARALIHKPKLLILDEPTAGVDIEIRRAMWQFLTELNQQGMTIILTTHYLEEAEQLCKNIAIINNGLIIENTSIKNLLQKLNAQTFILNLLQDAPVTLQLADFNYQLVDSHTLAVEVRQDQILNGLFSALSAQQIEVQSMRTKSNRLEELFLQLTKGTNHNG
jgi:ABC-2 type transport system ATP-binding protein